MSWADNHGLKTRINQIPLILCGPILRRVEPTSVSVFVVLKRSRQVSLKVYEVTVIPSGAVSLSFNNPIAVSIPVATIELGVMLHATVVTLKLPLNKQLQPGKLYGYDLEFTVNQATVSGDPVDLNTTSNFDSLGLLKGEENISYYEDILPTFSLPPTDINDLRIIHGSCRKPHGEALDAFVALDDMINESSNKPDKRPHQLYLTGDQIYADDVSDALLEMLVDTGDTLLGWDEQYPVIVPSPGYRSDYCKAIGITSGKSASKSHLLKLSEYYSMYLFAWSPVLWPKSQKWPKFIDVVSQSDQDSIKTDGIMDEISWTIAIAKSHLRKRLTKFTIEKKRLTYFYDSLIRVRRSLANIPTYMIFDDHEITDDWYLTASWSTKLLGNPVGKRVIQNGMLAYAIFQHWGNTPKQFELMPGPAVSKGKKLLDAAAVWRGQNTAADMQQESILKNLLLPIFNSNNKPTFTHGVQGGMDRSDNLEWHFLVENPNLEVIVLDTRTSRGYRNPNGGSFDPHRFPALLTSEAMVKQIPPSSVGTKKVTIVIAPSPIVDVPTKEYAQKHATKSEKLGMDAESWSLDEFAFESFLSMLAERGKNTSAGKKSRIVLLSGDVHYGFAARLQYWAKSTFGGGGSAQSIIVQLVSSSLKNETSTRDYDGFLAKLKNLKGTHSLHKWGYIPKLPVDWEALPLPKMGLGWNNKFNNGIVGIKRLEEYMHSHSFLATKTLPMEFIIIIEPPFVFNWGGRPIIKTASDVIQKSLLQVPLPIQQKGVSSLKKMPDWSYRIDYLLAERRVKNNTGFTPIAVNHPSSNNRVKALQEYVKVARNRDVYLRNYGQGKEIVGVNNIGEVTFNWDDGGDKEVVQELWWRLTSRTSGFPAENSIFLKPFPLSRWSVSLQFNDSEFPEPVFNIKP